MKVDPHIDFLGQHIEIDDLVVIGAGFDMLSLCKVIKKTPKMIRITRVLAKRPNKGKLVYGTSMLKIPSELATFYMLTREKK